MPKIEVVRNIGKVMLIADHGRVKGVVPGRGLMIYEPGVRNRMDILLEAFAERGGVD